MRTFTVNVNVEWKRGAYNTYNATATVAAFIPGIRGDESVGRARGWGYDKESAAVCYAVSDNPLMQTFAMWSEFNPNTEKYGTQPVRKTDYGYDYCFDGAGIEVFKDLMRGNGFDVRESHGNSFDSYTFTRQVPESFVAMI